MDRPQTEPCHQGRSCVEQVRAGGYRGSAKHKSRPGNGAKGTICPEWTHDSTFGGLGSDMHRHDWAGTEASKLFDRAVPYGGRRFATARGLAFEAKPTADGTWHGFPIPWESVPPSLTEAWLEKGLVDRRMTRMFRNFEQNDIYWPLRTDP